MSSARRAAYEPRTEEDWLALEYEIDQLFTPSTPIEMADYFSGRKTQIHELLEAVRERGQHAVLYGERGVGKSSLSKCFKDMFPKSLQRIRPYRIRTYPSNNFATLWKRMFDEWGAKAEVEGKRVPLSEAHGAGLSPDDVQREIRRFFKPNDIPIFIFDEFNDLVDKSASSQMAHLIKTLSDDGTNGTIILVGVASDISDIISNMKSIERCLRQVLMPRMLPDDLNKILDDRIPKLGMTIDDDAQERIVNLSRGLPAYIHSLGKFAARSAIHNKRLRIEEKDVDLAIDNILKRSQQQVHENYFAAVQSNRKDARFRQTLLACALSATDETGYFVPTAVLEPLQKILKRQIDLSDIQSHLDRFLKKEHGAILTRIGGSKRFRYRFADPIMQPFVIMMGIHDQLIPPRSKSLLAFNPQRSLSI
jgi:Cdc6-like AAA superfamily ATPase